MDPYLLLYVLLLIYKSIQIQKNPFQILIDKSQHESL